MKDIFIILEAAWFGFIVFAGYAFIFELHYFSSDFIILIFLFGVMPYKLHRDDVRVIERETGTQAKDLTEDDLKAAMKKLGIKKIELTPEDREAIERT